MGKGECAYVISAISVISAMYQRFSSTIIFFFLAKGNQNLYKKMIFFNNQLFTRCQSSLETC